MGGVLLIECDKNIDFKNRAYGFFHIIIQVLKHRQF